MKAHLSNLKSTRGQGTRRLAKHPVVLALLLTLVVAAGVMPSTAEAYPFTVAKGGSPGAYIGSSTNLYDISCTGTAWGYTPNIGLAKQIVGRSPAAPFVYQDGYMLATFQWSADTISWFTYTTSGWHKGRQHLAVTFRSPTSASTFPVAATSGEYALNFAGTQRLR